MNRNFALAKWVAAAVVFYGSSVSQAQPAIPDGPWQNSRFAHHVLGAWQGTGTVYGNEVSLTRSWTMELSNQFLVADMRVEMSNGLNFGALAYWRFTETGAVEITWLDEMGEHQTFSASVADSTGEVVIYHMEPATDDAPAGWRKTIYRITGADAYEEHMYLRTDETWVEIADFRFTRNPPQKP